MSGFDAGWLALREPVDHASRNVELVTRLRSHFAGRPSLVVTDLGCGTGSNLRALAPLLPHRQHWHLIDGDARLLAAARERLAAWADNVQSTAMGFLLIKGEHRIEVTVECADLTTRDLSFTDVCTELVTAAALFDLVSYDWLERLVASLARRRLPLYSVLNYDGIAHWGSDTSLDARVMAAFNRHQRGDKGFGPALGPMAGDTLIDLLAERGYSALSGDSPWRLGAEDTELIARLTEGLARAAREIEPEACDAFTRWEVERATAMAVTIGHRDVFATI